MQFNVVQTSRQTLNFTPSQPLFKPHSHKIVTQSTYHLQIHQTTSFHFTKLLSNIPSFLLDAANSPSATLSSNPPPSSTKHPSQSHRDHTSLCPSKISRPSVSILLRVYAQLPKFTATCQRKRFLGGTRHDGLSAFLRFLPASSSFSYGRPC